MTLTQSNKISATKNLMFDCPIYTSRKVLLLVQSFKPCFCLFLIATLTLLNGCLGNIVSHYKSEGYQSTSEPVFFPDSEIELHAPLTDSTFKSLVETPDGNFLASTENGWLLFDRDFRVQNSMLFGQKYTSTRAIATDQALWVYASRPSSVEESLSEHHLYPLNDPTSVYTYQCNTARVWWSSYVVDLDGDGHSSLALPCRNDELNYYVAFMNLRDGMVSEVNVPFIPSRSFLSKMSNGNQSINFIRSYPSVHLSRDIDTPSPIYRSLDTQKFNKVSLSIEETSTGHFIKNYSTIDKFFSFQKLVDKEFIKFDTVYPGNILLTWKFDGTLQNWWYFDLGRNFRIVGKWLDLSRRTEVEDKSVIAVLYGWGHWCQWAPCGYAILQLNTNGDYKLIDFTVDRVDSILVTTDHRLVATWGGKIYEYDLDAIRNDIQWQKSLIPTEHLAWMSERSGLSVSEIRETYEISDE